VGAAEHRRGGAVGLLTTDGAECRYHGDFDWPGLRIAQALGQRVPWTPWRYTAADYLAALEADPLSRSLTGRPALSPWDPELAEVMAERDLALEEEAVAERLSDDLVADHPAP
jgi:uncharacterized protein (TIGR02679 family)